ncbi:MAG: DUF488 domain-containing protein [Candidatus Tectomicrobia bacterium]|nr:DUF488 domain-containing protein [Candidatus Tectomicrobia bacterium]
MTRHKSTAFTIGHSNHAAEKFLRLLVGHRIEEVLDVRSSPHSRFNPHFNRRALETTLDKAGVGYGFMGDTLGGRPADSSCYDREGRVQYDRLAETDAFKAGMRQVIRRAGERRAALMCSEKEPLHCHRTLLIARVLTNSGINVSHILADGGLEDHAAAMDRLLDRFHLPRDGDMFCTRERHIAIALGRQAQQVAYVGKPPGAV